MADLKKGARLLFDFLRNKQANEIVTQQDICVATGWKPDGTLKTYLAKNKLSRFLYRDGNVFRVLRDGRELTEDEFHTEFTQVNPERLVLRQNIVVEGNKGRYSLDHYQGAGATAQVWRASRGDVPVAVKMHDPRFDLLRPSVLSNVRERFEREAKMGAKLSHDAVVRVLDTGLYNGRPFLVMEYAEATASQLSTRGVLTPQSVHGIIVSVAEALGYLHHEGLVHRDVKPDNILKVNRGHVLGDLGIVRWTDFSQESLRAGTITRASVQLGSWYYMAPEQRAAPHEAVAASDIYSLGVTWYELLTGRPAPAPEWFAAGQVDPVPGLPEVTAFVLHMTSFRPADRPTVAQVVDFARRTRG